MKQSKIRYTCKNPAICNKFGFQPNEKCAKAKCKFVAKEKIKEAPIGSTKGFEW